MCSLEAPWLCVSRRLRRRWGGSKRQPSHVGFDCGRPAGCQGKKTILVRLWQPNGARSEPQPWVIKVGLAVSSLRQERSLEERMARASEISSYAVFFFVFVWQLGGFALSGRSYNYSVCLPSLLSGTSLERPERSVFWRRTRGSVCGESCQGLKKRETELRCERLEFFSSRSKQTTCGVPARRLPWHQLTEVHRRTSAACGRRASPNRRQHMYTRWEEP